MTANESANRNRLTRDKIITTLRGDQNLSVHCEAIRIEICDSQVILDGSLPSPVLVDQLVPAVRRAGVLCRVANRVRVAA